jgi:hypothetical protein
MNDYYLNIIFPVIAFLTLAVLLTDWLAVKLHNNTSLALALIYPFIIGLVGGACAYTAWRLVELLNTR